MASRERGFVLETMTGARRGALAARTRAAIDDHGEGPRLRPAPWRPGATRWLAVAALAVLAVPLVVAAIALHSPRWHPTLDFAMTELRVRDVPTSDAPLVGLAGRLQAHGEQGSHPGPLSFWLLWPVYRLLGASGWALQVSTAVLNLAAAGVALWIAGRRAGRVGVLATAAGLAVLAHGLGIDRLTEPWNPYMPVLWWVVLLLALWSVLSDDLPLLPVAVFAGSFCAQTHVPYVGTVAGLLALATTATVVGAARRGPDQRRRAARWGLLSAGLLVLLWLPPVVEQLRGGLGNLSIIRETFAHPPEPPLGVGWRAVEAWLSQLDPWGATFPTDTFGRLPIGSVGAGAVLLAAWVVAAAASWRRRRAEPSLWRLHGVVAAALGLGLVSITRIHGEPFQYLALWARATTVLVVAAVGWTVAAAVAARASHRAAGGSRPGPLPGALRASAGVAALVVVVLVATADLTVDASTAQPPDPGESETIALVAPQTVAAIRAVGAPGGGADGRYLVRWADTVAIMPAGYGFLLELERQGLHVGTDESHAVPFVRHRVLADDEATGTLVLTRGERLIESLRAAIAAGAEVTELAYADPRTPAERARADELYALIASRLEAEGLADLRAQLDERAMMVPFDPRTPDDVVAAVDEMVALKAPVAVFAGPPGESWLAAVDSRLARW